MLFSVEWWKKWPKDGAWSIDWSDVLGSLKWSRSSLRVKADGHKRGRERLLIVRLLILKDATHSRGGALEKFALTFSPYEDTSSKGAPQTAFLSFVWVSVSVLHRDTEPMVWFLLRNLATWLWISWRIRRVWLIQLFMPTCHLLAKFPACWREVSLCSSQAFDWSDETTPTLWMAICFYSKSPDLNVTFIQKTLSEKYPE